MDQLNKIHEKLDIIIDRLNETDKILAVQAEQLAYHIKRSDQLDTALGIIKNDLKPIEKHVSRVEGAFKLLALLASIAAVVKMFI